MAPCPRDAANRLLSPRADPQRGSHRLDGTRRKREVAHPREAPLEGHSFLSPEPLQKFHAFGEPRRSLRARHAQRRELIVRVALSDAEIETPVRENVDTGRVLGDTHRVLEWEQENERADADPRSTRRDGSRRRQQRRIVAVRREMVLGQPNIVVADLLGATDLVEDRSIEIGKRTTPGQWVTKIFHEAESHRYLHVQLGRLKHAAA